MGEIATADVNGDGFPDMAVCGSVGSSWGVAVFLSDGDGTLTAKNDISGYCGAVAIADFDGDGSPDMAVAGLSSVQILLGKGDGTFRTGTHIPVGSFAMATGDIDDDGNVDLILSTATGSTALYTGKGDGTFVFAMEVSSDQALTIVVTKGRHPGTPGQSSFAES